MLYLIQTGEFYKIGYSKDFNTLRSRIKIYKTHNPIFKLLDINLGSRDDETMVHQNIELNDGEWSKDKEATLDLWFSLKEPIAQKLIDREKDYTDYNCLRIIQLEEEIDTLRLAYRSLIEKTIPIVLRQEERLQQVENSLGYTTQISKESEESLKLLKKATE